MSNEVASSHIYIGPWIDQSEGSALGAYLTLTSRDAAILSAFLSIFIIWIGTHLWAIERFIAHSFRSNTRPQNGLFHQQQAILRNSEAPGASLWTFIVLIWSWRTTKVKTLARTSPLIIMAVIHIGVIAAAGLLSSKIGKKGEPNPVLLSPHRCGAVYPQALGTDSRSDPPGTWGVYLSAIAITSMQYARACYAGEVVEYVKDPRCRYHIRRSVGEQKKTSSANCPFNSSMCATGTALEIDTGYISSDEDLGINTGSKDRLWFRKVTTWSPITLDGRKRPCPAQPRDTCYYLGLSSLAGKTTDWTAKVFENEQNLGHGYFLSYRHGRRNGDSGDGFDPIPELQQDTTELALIELRNYVRYKEPVIDPLFFANTTRTNVQEEFQADDVVTFLGLTTKYQICTSLIEPVCSKEEYWIGREEGDLAFLGLSLTATQDAIARLILTTAVRTSLSLGFASLAGPDLLLANNYRQGHGHDISVGIPQDHWQKEAENMHNMTLAALQEFITEFPAARRVQLVPHSKSPPSTLDFTGPPEFPSTAILCDKIKVLRQGYVSYLQLGVGFVFGLGGLIILTNLGLADLVNLLRTRKSSPPEVKAKALDWINLDFLQLQRAMFEGKGIKPWKRELKSVPVPNDDTLEWKNAGEATIELRTREREDSTLLRPRGRDDEEQYWSDAESQTSQPEPSHTPDRHQTQTPLQLHH